MELIITLDDKVRAYKRLLDRKDSLEEEVKRLKADKDQLEQEICRLMIDDEKPNTVVDGFTYSLSQKNMYEKKSEEELFRLKEEEGIEFFEVLREQGLGDLIVERVDPRTLQSAISNMVEDLGGEAEELPEDLAKCLNVYEKLSLSKRKANMSALNRAKQNQNI